MGRNKEFIKEHELVGVRYEIPLSTKKQIDKYSKKYLGHRSNSKFVRQALVHYIESEAYLFNGPEHFNQPVETKRRNKKKVPRGEIKDDYGFTKNQLSELDDFIWFCYNKGIIKSYWKSMGISNAITSYRRTKKRKKTALRHLKSLLDPYKDVMVDDNNAMLIIRQMEKVVK